VRLEASTKPPIHEFLINMASTMACPNFKKSLKMDFGPLGVKITENIQFLMRKVHKNKFCASFQFYFVG
jgi:hypothetical protein